MANEQKSVHAEDLTIEQLKAHAFDERSIIDALNAQAKPHVSNLNVILAELNKRAEKPEEVKDEPKKD